MTVIATGFVFGNYWGGGTGIYTARELKAETREDIVKQIMESKDIGEFDGGMGYEKVLGVFYRMEEIVVEGEWEKNRKLEHHFENRGMTEAQVDWFKEWGFGRVSWV
jgi:hypothetical protein